MPVTTLQPLRSFPGLNIQSVPFLIYRFRRPMHQADCCNLFSFERSVRYLARKINNPGVVMGETALCTSEVYVYRLNARFIRRCMFVDGELSKILCSVNNYKIADNKAQ